MLVGVYLMYEFFAYAYLLSHPSSLVLCPIVWLCAYTSHLTGNEVFFAPIFLLPLAGLFLIYVGAARWVRQVKQYAKQLQELNSQTLN
jgi:hypothetical protein